MQNEEEYNEKPWREYEHVVRDILEERIREDCPGAELEVFHNREYLGKSKVKHQIDVSAEVILGGMRIVFLVECKLKGQRKVGKQEVEVLANRISDIPEANKGLVITTVGFQSGAKGIAEANGIALALKGKDEKVSWETVMPALVSIALKDMKETPSVEESKTWKDQLQDAMHRLSGRVPSPMPSSMALKLGILAFQVLTLAVVFFVMLRPSLPEKEEKPSNQPAARPTQSDLSHVAATRQDLPPVERNEDVTSDSAVTPTPIAPAVAVLPLDQAHGQRKSGENKADLIKSKYSFEEPVRWVAQDYKDSRACVAVRQSKAKVKEGLFSLQMDMDLVGGDKHRSKGEAWVDMFEYPPKGEKKAPFDLTNQKITVWVYAPRGARGHWQKPNGFQVFVKDAKYKCQYGTWRNVEEEKWVKISLNVSAAKPKGGYMDTGFKPSDVMAIGVKMGAGGGSKETYKGPVYIDAVDWSPVPSAKKGRSPAPAK